MLGTVRAVPASELRETPIVRAVKAARPAVVNIRGEKTLITTAGTNGQIDAARRVNGMGTGVIIDSRGYIITNHHVVDGVREIQITLADGRQFIAELVARDPETDLAIIKINAPEPLTVINIGTSSDLMPGESVVAVGNAYGYEHTATRGIVSALHRAVQVSDAQFYDDLIQTDASINPGNSGGPLLNIDGEMIGINVAVRAGAQGIGFAIPVDKVVRVASELFAQINEKRVRHGLEFADTSPLEHRLVVAKVEPESPAAEAGIEPGDVIVRVGDIPIRSRLDFQRAILDKSPDDELDIVVSRSGEEVAADLALAAPAASTIDHDATWELLGLRLEPMPADEFNRRFRTHYRGGLLITEVRPGSPAAAQGLRAGDVLVGMHIWETVNLENVKYIMNRPDLASLLPLKFYILRGNDTYYGYLSVAMHQDP
ncbi:MAG: PDZ domain-containing protein [Planctomycetota bacterium]|nr:MAG: PDZ domain-containing protein [Planctomycetota bacterium]